jgi:ribonuclease BN (tRNA processing enzyme)
VARLTFLGTADAFNSGGRGHSAYWVEDALGVYTVDFGPTALMACERFGLPLDRLDAVFLTHLHGDHIGGLAVLLVTLRFELMRTRPLVIAGPPGTRARVTGLLASAFPTLVDDSPFEIEWPEWQVPGTVTVLGRRVQTIRAVHDRVAIATSFRVSSPDAELAFSGDTGWQPELPDLVRGADLFVCECSNVEPGYTAHLSVTDLLEHRDELEVRCMYVSHMCMASRVAAKATPALRVIVPDDGDVVEI